LLGIETSLGRVRRDGGYSSRLIDIDILFYEDLVTDKNNLIIPHPHLHERRFVLEPLAEIAPDFVHPAYDKKMIELLEITSDISIVKFYKRPIE